MGRKSNMANLIVSPKKASFSPPPLFFCSLLPSSSYFTSLPSPLWEEAHLSPAFADMAIWAH